MLSPGTQPSSTVWIWSTTSSGGCGIRALLRLAHRAFPDPEVRPISERCTDTGKQIEARDIWLDGLNKAPDHSVIREAASSRSRRREPASEYAALDETLWCGRIGLNVAGLVLRPCGNAPLRWMQRFRTRTRSQVRPIPADLGTWEAR